MPYISVPETISDICQAWSCSAAEALVRLRNGLADGTLVCRWGDGFKYELSSSTERGTWWLKAKIRIPGDGKVLDDYPLMPDEPVLPWAPGLVPRHRTLLIFRDPLSGIWRLPPAPVAPPAAGPATTRTPAYSHKALVLWWVNTLVPRHEKAGTIPKRGGAKRGDVDEAWEAAKAEVSRWVPLRAIRKLRADPKLTPPSWRTRGRRRKK